MTPSTQSSLHAAGVPARFYDRTLGDFRVERPDQQRAVEAAMLVVDKHIGMMLLGPVGTGKTHIAVGIVAELDEQGRLYDEFGRPKARFISVPELLDSIRATVRYPGSDDPLAPLLTVPLLILDDLGAEKPTEWVMDRLYVLVNRRYNERLVTVATSNYSLNELVERGYDRIVSRLCEGASVVVVNGPDERMA